MSPSIAPTGRSFSPSPPQDRRMQWGANALSAPTTPGKRQPVIDKTKVDPEIRRAAEGMEAMFLDFMMQVMRKTVPKNEMDLESPASEIYRGLLDTETAQRAAHAGGVGLADQIVAYLESQRYTLREGKGAPSVQGGTDEGRPNRE